MPVTADDYAVPPDFVAEGDPTGGASGDEAFGIDFPQLLEPPPVGDRGVVTDPVTSGGDPTASDSPEEDEDE